MKLITNPSNMDIKTKMSLSYREETARKNNDQSEVYSSLEKARTLPKIDKIQEKKR